MENKILELLEQKGSVSMNDDIFPLVEKEFEGQVIGAYCRGCRDCCS